MDSKDKETGAKRREKIYFSINDVANPDLAFSKLFGHEKAHMNTYDEGKDGEETSIHTREKIGSENKNKVFTEEEKADYLNNLRNKYKDQKSIEQQFAEAKLVPEKDKEHFDPILTPSLIVGGTALIYRYGPEITEAAMEYGPMLLSIMMDPPKINKKDEIDNLDDIKNFKPIVIPNKENKILDNDEDTLVMLTKGSTKNEKKSNKNRVKSAENNLQNLREELKDLKQKPNKTPEDKEKIKEIEKRINKELSRIQKSENHSRIRKHS